MSIGGYFAEMVQSGALLVAMPLRPTKSPVDTVGTGFAGSPTITADGADIFPDGAPSSDLACRIYPTPGGHTGVPTVDQVKEALTNHGL